MSVKVGDRVKFLNSVGGGVVTKLKDKKIALVLTDDEWEMPYLIKELLVVAEKVEPKKRTEVESPQIEEEEEEDFEVEINDNKDVNIYLAFVPQNENNVTNCDLELFLINDSNYYIYYNILNAEGKKHQSLNGTLEPNTKMLLKNYERKDLNFIDNYQVQLLFFMKRDFDLRPAYDESIKINPVKFFKAKSFKENDFFDEISFIVPVLVDKYHLLQQLTESDIRRVIVDKEVTSPKSNQPKVFKKNDNPAFQEEVVDLHIHELIEDSAGLKPKDIIDIQINRFRTDLESALKRKIKSITFIHGIGNGTLKYELRRILDKEYKKNIYQDASFKEYGFGATMVMTR